MKWQSMQLNRTGRRRSLAENTVEPAGQAEKHFATKHSSSDDLDR
jgi:hypothetical protein